MIAEEGVLYAYEPVAQYETEGRLVYFGRSKSARALSAEVREEQMRILFAKRSGLNKPERICFWVHVPNITQAWDQLREVLCAQELMYGKVKRLMELGDNWYDIADSAGDLVEWLRSKGFEVADVARESSSRVQWIHHY